MGLGATWWFYKIMMVRIMIIYYQHDHRDHNNNLCHNHYLVQSTRTGWKRTMFCAQMGVAAWRSNQISEFQDKDTFVTMIVSNIFQHFKEISEVCYIHIYIYTLSYLQYIHIYTIHTIYLQYIQIYTIIYKYICKVVMWCDNLKAPKIYVKLWCDVTT